MPDERPRGFDWGPPDAGRFEFLREWGVYALLILLIGAGIWFLVDSVGPGERNDEIEVPFSRSAPRSGVTTAAGGAGIPATATIPVPASSTLSTTSQAALKPVFLVQLGAFGEEQAALEAQARLRRKGYVASLTVPDQEYELYRLLLGPFSEEKQADETARKLNEMDFPCFVIESL